MRTCGAAFPLVSLCGMLVSFQGKASCGECQLVCVPVHSDVLKELASLRG